MTSWLDVGPPRCSGGLYAEACSALATVICTKETHVAGAPPITWFACDEPLHQRGGTPRTITKKYGPLV